MTYNKPKLVVLGRAVLAIQSGQNKPNFNLDNVDVNHPMNATATAYESDE